MWTKELEAGLIAGFKYGNKLKIDAVINKEPWGRNVQAFAMILYDTYMPSPEWVREWTARMGQPKGLGFVLPGGTWRREFANGSILYNPVGCTPSRIEWPELRTDSEHNVATEHMVQPGQGDGYKRIFDK